MTCRKKASGNQHFLLFPQYLYPAKQMFSGVILESACLSIRLCVLPTVCPTIHVSVCVQNTSYCQSTGWGIKSHLVTALVSSLYMTKIIILVSLTGSLSSANALNLVHFKRLWFGKCFNIVVFFFQ